MARPLRTAFQNIRANAIDRRNQRRQRRTGDYQVPMNNMDSMSASDKSNVSTAGHFRTAQAQVAGGYMLPKGELPQPQKAQVGADTKDVNADRIYPQVDPTNLAKQGGSKISGPAGPKGVADSKAEDSTLPPLPRQQTTARNPDVITSQGQQAAPQSRELPNYYNAGPQQQAGMPPMAGQGQRRGFGNFLRRGIGALLHMPQQTDNSQEEASRRQDLDRSYAHQAAMQHAQFQYQRANADHANQMNTANRTEQSRQEAPATQIDALLGTLQAGVPARAVAQQIFDGTGQTDASVLPQILQNVRYHHFNLLTNPIEVKRWVSESIQGYMQPDAKGIPGLSEDEAIKRVEDEMVYLRSDRETKMPMQEQQQTAAIAEPIKGTRESLAEKAAKEYDRRNSKTRPPKPQPLGY